MTLSGDFSLWSGDDIEPPISNNLLVVELLAVISGVVGNSELRPCLNIEPELFAVDWSWGENFDSDEDRSDLDFRSHQFWNASIRNN